LVVFDSVASSRGISKGVKQAIVLKCNQYEARLKKLDKYLLANADLSQLFKDVVEYHKRPDSQTSSSQNSISSETWKSLKDCPLYRQGIEAIERGKKKDQRGYFLNALHYYEDGMSLLLEAAGSNQDGDASAQENIEHLRFKCLLIHERIEMIRNHLEGGLPLKPINDYLDTIEYSLNGQSESSMSPEPQDAEDQTLRSAELGSSHSVYDTSMAARNADTPRSIPLADLDGELKLSNLSLASSRSLQSIKSYSASVKGSHEDTFGEADFNVTELTVANSGLDLDVYLNGSGPDSDSGISDQSPKVDNSAAIRSRHESSAYASSNEDEAMLQVHRNGDGTLVVARSSPPPAVKISPSASIKRQAKLKALADELTVLSQEDVIDSTLIKTGDNNQEEIAVPPRAFATLQDEEEEFNKGCYYFIACLDSLWIL